MGNKEIAELDKIREIAGKIYNALKPCKVYLFGSFAKGTQKKDSDYDFYVVVNDSVVSTVEAAQKAQISIGLNRNRAIDIVAERESRYNRLKGIGCAIESCIAKEGVLVYE